MKTHHSLTIWLKYKTLSLCYTFAMVIAIYSTFVWTLRVPRRLILTSFIYPNVTGFHFFKLCFQRLRLHCAWWSHKLSSAHNQISTKQQNKIHCIGLIYVRYRKYSQSDGPQDGCLARMQILWFNANSGGPLKSTNLS